MSALSRRWIAIGGILAAIGVGLGAYGAHGLKDTLVRAGFAGDDLTHRLAIFETAGWRFVPWAFLAGIILFCGPLKLLTFAGDEWKWLGAVVPFGGASMIAGWIALAVCALRK